MSRTLESWYLPNTPTVSIPVFIARDTRRRRPPPCAPDAPKRRSAGAVGDFAAPCEPGAAPP